LPKIQIEKLSTHKFIAGLHAHLRRSLAILAFLAIFVGITTPRPEHERKVLLLWIGIFIVLLGTGVAVVMFLMSPPAAIVGYPGF
jgi:threonine/homoserine/homoserine lactone efflux protein